MGKDSHRIIFAVFLSFCITFAWSYFFPQANDTPSVVVQSKNSIITSDSKVVEPNNLGFGDKPEQRIKISSPRLSGSISTKGLRFDDLSLLEYKETAKYDSRPVFLFNPENLDHFIDVYFVSTDSKKEVPGPNTVWSLKSGSSLSQEHPVEFYWNSPSGVKFVVKIALDENYLFTLDSCVINHSKQEIEVGRCTRIFKSKGAIELSQDGLHSGAIGIFDKQLSEYSYKDLKKRGNLLLGSPDWFGITDKYWLAAVVPQDHDGSASLEKHQLSGKEYMMIKALSPIAKLAPNNSFQSSVKLFTGAKQLSLLEHYRSKLDIPLLDRAIDFGWLYFLAKPLLYALKFFYGIFGNFGLSIICLTFLLRIAIFGISYKSDSMMQTMKDLQPQLNRLKEIYKDNKEKLQKETLELYKKAKVNPVGCLPMVAQIPVLFAMYKVLSAAIEMRHAPFYLWITDLSVPDPTNLVTLFGLIPWTPPSFLHIGLWPMFMAGTTYLQQKLSPMPQDPIQAKMFALMPFILLFTFANFPAGLLIYWTWSNIFGILQQYLTKRFLRVRQTKH